MCKRDMFSDLPRWVKDYSDDQRERVITYLACKPLAELRKRQGVIHSQMSHIRPLPPGQREQVLTDLQNMFDLESAAISLQISS